MTIFVILYMTVRNTLQNKLEGNFVDRYSFDAGSYEKCRRNSETLLDSYYS